MDEDDLRAELDPAVRTLAETYYECGFEPQHALDMAWENALQPFRARGEDLFW